MEKRVQLALTVLLSLISIEVFSLDNWIIDKSKNGIIVYTKLVKNSDFKSFKAVTILDSSPEIILGIFRDAHNYKNWYAFTKTSILLKSEDDIQYNYVETVFPWPYSNRDMVYKMSIFKNDNSSIEIHLLGLPDYIPEKKGIVRMNKATGSIYLRPIGQKTEITYIFHSEPGDNIPPWLANNAISELPIKTLIALESILKEHNNQIK